LGELRLEHGGPLFDWLLHVEGSDNRIEVSSVIRDSNAERNGLERGDVIRSYGDHLVYQVRELRDATQRGELGDSVTLEIERNGRTQTVRLERGPMGVQLHGRRVVPEELP